MIIVKYEGVIALVDRIGVDKEQLVFQGASGEPIHVYCKNPKAIFDTIFQLMQKNNYRVFDIDYFAEHQGEGKVEPPPPFV